MRPKTEPSGGTGELLRSLFEATAGETGDEFFRALVKELAELLGSRHAFIAELVPGGTHAHALAYWADGRFLRPFQYDLSNSPCETVLSGKIVHVPENLLARYPDDKILSRLGFESYLGIPLLSREGDVLGHVAATDDKPMHETSRDYSTFEVFASRVTAELERRRADAALARVQSKLIQAEKLSSLGQLTAGVAHEINTPAGIIQGNADLTKRLLEKLRRSLDEGGPNAEIARCFDTLMEANEASSAASRRIADLVSSLKKFTRLDAAEYQESDLREGLESTLAFVEPHLPEGVAIERHYGVNVPRIRCHPAELNQVFMTVVRNAVDAVENEGAITVTLTCDDQNVYVEVSDNGPGIPSEELGTLFDIGFTEKDSRMRMRVGLSAAYHIVKSHDGDITVKSKPDEGTTFRIALPRG